MNTPPDVNQAKRNASFRSRYVTSRTLTILGVVMAFLVIAMFVPW